MDNVRRFLFTLTPKKKKPTNALCIIHVFIGKIDGTWGNKIGYNPRKENL